MEAPAGVLMIACGALAREILDITKQLPAGAVELTCLPAIWHNHPEKIVPGLKRKIDAAKKTGRNIVVIYGDCGTGGAIDAYLESESIPRVPGPHCYEMFLGKSDFDAEMEAELGTFFLTDYMVRHFERLVMKGMGLRQHPQLRDMYFGNYKRVLYMAQTEDPALLAKARAAAAMLALDFDYRFAGYGAFTDFISTASQTANAVNS
jgi:hypothetical protein